MEAVNTKERRPTLVLEVASEALVAVAAAEGTAADDEAEADNDDQESTTSPKERKILRMRKEAGKRTRKEMPIKILRKTRNCRLQRRG